MNNRQTISNWLVSELLGIGIVIIVAGLIWGYSIHSFFIAIAGSGIGIFLIRKSSLNRTARSNHNNLSQEHLPTLIFKNNVAAFEYICAYVVFPQDMAVGIVVSAAKTNEYTEVKIKCLFNDQIIMVDNSLNLLNNRAKEGDLVVCLLFAGRMVVNYLLDHKFNPNTLGWKVLFNKGDLKIDEIPVDHLEQPRLQFI